MNRDLTTGRPEIVLAAALSRTALGSTGIWCAWPIGWVVATILSVLFYCSGDWMRETEEKL